jgi:hypothetical protein
MENTHINEAGQMIAEANIAAHEATLEALETLDATLVAIRATLPETLETDAKRNIDLIRSSYAYRIMPPPMASQFNAPQPVTPTSQG